MAERRARSRDVFRYGDFRLLFYAFVVDQVGSWAYNVVLIVWVFDRTHSPTWIAATTAAGWGPRLLCSPYAGVLADRFERTQVLIASALLSFVSMTGVALVVARQGPPAAALVLAAAAASFATGYRPAAGAVLPEVVGERDLIAANTVFGALENLVVVLGPALGGLLLVAGSPAVGIEMNALSFLGAALLVTRMSIRSHGGAIAGESVLRQLADGAIALWRRPVVLALVLFCYLDSAVYGASTVIYVPLSERLGTGPNGFSYLLAGSCIGGVLLAAAANRISAMKRLAPVILVGMLMLALPFAATAPVRQPVVAFGLQIITGGGMILVDILAITALQRDLPNEVLSRVLGLFWAGVPAALLVSSFVCAAVLRAVGLTNTLLLIGFGFSAAAVVGLVPLLRVDRRTLSVLKALGPRISLLESLGLFDGASRLTLELLARSATEVQLPAGTVVVREGDRADALWVLADGDVAVSARGEAAHARRLRTMTAPCYFGEIGLLRELPRTATVRTLLPCTLLRIEGGEFLDAVRGAGLSRAALASSAAQLARSHPQLAKAVPLEVAVSQE